MVYNDPHIKLPIRLAPRRSRAILDLLLSVTGAGLFLAIIMPRLPAIVERTSVATLIVEYPILTICVLLFAFIFTYSLMFSILKALPGAPFVHLDISDVGITHRRFFKRQSVTWRQIHQFSVVERWQRNGKSKKRHWWVLAENHGGWESGADVARRISQALLAFDANDLAPILANGEEVATALRDNLDDYLKSINGGGVHPKLKLLPILRDVAVVPRHAIATIRGEPAKEVTVKRKPRSSSVIER
jgi:hypothetical protein